jgi:transposase
MQPNSILGEGPSVLQGLGPCDQCRHAFAELICELARKDGEIVLLKKAGHEKDVENARLQNELAKSQNLLHKIVAAVRDYVPGAMRMVSRAGELVDAHQTVLTEILAAVQGSGTQAGEGEAGARDNGSPSPTPAGSQPSADAGAATGSATGDTQTTAHAGSTSDGQREGSPSAGRVDGRATSRHHRKGIMNMPEGARIERVPLPDPEILVTGRDGRPLVKIGEKMVEERVCLKPAELIIKQYISAVYGEAETPLEEGIVSEAPATILPHVGIEHETIATVSSMRYELLLPLYRCSEWLNMNRWLITRGTLSRWLMAAAPLGVAQAIKDGILRLPCVSFDDTRWWVLRPETDEEGTPSFISHGEAHQACIFALADANGPAIYYVYRPNKRGEHLLDLLRGYRGVLLIDDNRGYKSPLEELRITYANCWAHVQTKIDEAEDKTWGPGLLATIKHLFDLDRLCQDQPAAERLRHRQTYCRPVLEQFFSSCTAVQKALTPRDPLGNAVDYAIRLRPGLSRFLDNPDIPLSNNGIERGFRPYAISRRNSLFSDSERGARASAAWMTVIQTARRTKVPVHPYLVWMMDQVAAGRTDYGNLTPAAYQQLAAGAGAD